MPDGPPYLLLTRPQADSERFLAALATDVPFTSIISPLTRIAMIGDLPDLADAGGLVFTSRHGVAAYAKLGGRTDLPAYAVGKATAQAAREAGLAVDHSNGSADDLVAMLLQRCPQGPLVHMHGVHTRGDVARRLTQGGVPCGSAILYDQVAQSLSRTATSALASPGPVVVPLFSPRNAKLLTEARPQAALLVAAMSEAVAKAAEPLHSRVLRVAPRPDSSSMRDCVVHLLQNAQSLEAWTREV